MSASNSWAGFTDDDLHQMKHTSANKSDTAASLNVKKSSLVQKQKLMRERSTPNGKRQTSDGKGQTSFPSGHVSLPPEQMLSPPRQTDNSHNNHEVSKTSLKHNDKETLSIQKEPAKNSKEEHEGKELNEKEGLDRDMSTLEKFQQQQKLIEEANKQKRDMLTKTIQERKKKAKAETSKLMKIQKELGHLDHLATVDVSVIRDKIETASREFLDAQRYYERAEKEFVESKIDLYKKSESKEKLTEHLYAIIQQNEMRKSRKLAELMEQLELEVTTEEVEISLLELPALTSFNPVQTLHNPKSPPVKSELSPISSELSTDTVPVAIDAVKPTLDDTTEVSSSGDNVLSRIEVLTNSNDSKNNCTHNNHAGDDDRPSTVRGVENINESAPGQQSSIQSNDVSSSGTATT